MNIETRMDGLMKEDQKIIDQMKEIDKNKIPESEIEEPEPVNPKDYIDKIILFELRAGPMNRPMYVSIGVIKTVSPNGFLEIEEWTPGAVKIKHKHLCRPEEVYILDVLDE